MAIRAIVHVFATAGVLLLLARLVPGIAVAGLYPAFIVALVWGLLGLTIRPILSLLMLPINLLTFGLFSFVLNALLFWFVASFIEGFSVAGFVPALIGSLALAAVSYVVHRLF
ncbi:MAG: hypothetical protein UY83_C0003G0005 [Candidatus Adlerbacteria bacterium GW2011_GWA1_54_10]|uniref:Phage holin family protein n=3 Tax=Candidatus Adleribacteriota TaxID=1752736 RepID=A0A1F4Y096_9BACT|nr:MAG: hypothetical protein UY83_C0003G0005 [Candidatus Adlerbacteria bacterium GW2011_GWA1_54_10]KKW37450.1 MAG: hypothetical protein UY86_C0008G0007 [Candidatus Adlerbacteria bacterium GW2011_GWB1_54_7]OGC87372.1 MAG: hypothetical protein A3B33_00285 [Candidatus Adlerbacteria bacterium RIFCSPLOWO2_01_FULL_54_16]